MRLKPLAWSVLLALASPLALAEGEAAAAPSSAPSMGPIEIELPAGYEEEMSKAGTSQKGLQVLEALEVKGEWEDKDEKGKSDVYRKDISGAYVGKKELERYKGASVGDVFRGLNGVYSGDARNSGALDPNIRGIQGEGRIPVTVDGTEQASSVWMGSAGVSNRNYVDPSMIGSIAVEKGPSMTPGVKSGVGGSVQIKTLEAEDIVRPGEQFGLEIKSETATNSVKPDETAMDYFGKDYRDIEGVSSGYNGQLAVGNKAIMQVSPHTQNRGTDFDFNDNAFRIAAGARHDDFDLLAAYSYRKKGNYYSGKGGSQRYQTDKWWDEASAVQGGNVSGAVATGYVANLYAPGQEVVNTSSEMRTSLLKGTWYLPDQQSLKLTYMRSEQEFGESVPYLISYMVRNKPEGEDYALQFPYSEIKQDTYSLTYNWNPDENPLIDLQAGVWMTQNNSRRHQNGDEVYGIAATFVSDQDVGYNNYVRCMAAGTAASCGAAPQRLPNTDGRFNVLARALQVSDHDRWGVNLSNRMQLTDSLVLTLAGNFSDEKLAQQAAADVGSTNLAAWVGNFVGTRSGSRQEFNFTFNNEWSATPWLVLNAGARFADYSAFDDGLAKHRKNKDAGWGDTSAVVGQAFSYRELMTATEAQAFRDGLRAEVESWGLPDEMVDEMVEIELANTTVDGYLYKNKTSFTADYDGFRIDTATNKFRNGEVDLKETVSNAQGGNGNALRYVGYANEGAVVEEVSENDRWSKPDKLQGTAWTPMFGATFLLTDRARIYIRYSEFVRFPSVYEATQSTFGGLRRASAVGPEHSYNWEAGYVHDLRGFMPDFRYADFRINYYKNEIRDFIDRDYYFNIVQFDKKKYSGIELQTRFDTGRYFVNLGGTYRLKQELCDKEYAATLEPFFQRDYSTCVTAGFPTTFARTSLQPKYSIDLDGGVRLFGEALELGGRMTYHSSAKNEDEEEWIRNGSLAVTTGNRPFQWHPVWVFDAYASYQVNKSLDLEMGVNNITNRYYIDPLARVMMPAPGRTLKAGFTVRF
ncbi:MAG: TonB-dependent receptor [Candidatus Pseudomonas phytovorans]|uniref:TonB-dependent receptor n=1 Tax=Candidatus Pseudomonas phytovorans TaxID=3121377 RepID=A0AAJ6BDA4_9PSED|nr:TonB-dependent receptor [Pseudomonas sp.]WEK31534.1 MAG: TonB-dependent receptor [Pseudomonas sp.]